MVGLKEATLLVVLATVLANVHSIDHPKREFRAIWIAGVANIDWPSKQGLSVEKQKAEFKRMVAEARQDNCNVLIVHIRPTADSYYPSKIFPWSKWITGQQGKDPGYDPLKFAIEEAHKSNLELHAWFNPYRIDVQSNMSKLVDYHPARKHPDWVVKYGKLLLFNPGIPEVRELVASGIMEVVNNYDVDAIHFDDYFYPYPDGQPSFNDSATYKKYAPKNMSLGDWRRNNTDNLIKMLSQRIKAAKQHVKFGISPFGIWRNKKSDPRGSATNGFQSYDGQFADTRRWVKEQWIDYIVPQLYWSKEDPLAPYNVLAKWWADVADKTNVQLYIGHAVTRIDPKAKKPEWRKPDIIESQIEFNRNLSQIFGSVFWNMKHLSMNKLGSRDILRNKTLKRPALVPLLAGRHEKNTEKVHIMQAAESNSSRVVNLSWQPNPVKTKAWYFAVYRLVNSTKTAPDMNTANDLVAVVRNNKKGGVTHYYDRDVRFKTKYTYFVSAVTRLHEEGPLCAPVSVTITK